VLGERIGWRWWKVIDGGLFTLNGSRPVPIGPFETDFPERGGMAAFKHRDGAERMFATLNASWALRAEAVTFQSELPAEAPRVAPARIASELSSCGGQSTNANAATSANSFASTPSIGLSARCPNSTPARPWHLSPTGIWLRHRGDKSINRSASAILSLYPD
jgi:hypothetical protein